MITLPAFIMTRLAPFSALFSRRVWRHVPILVGGAILAPGRRMVSTTLRVMGLSQCRAFSTYHRVLNRAVWSSLAVSRVLLGLLIAAFAPSGPLVVGIDETLERRRGAKIAAKGIYRDAARSSKAHFAKASGLRWVCLMLLVPIPWAQRVWALPFLTVLAPSERYHRRRGQRHKSVTDWARQMLLVLRRWLPQRPLVVVADRTYAVLSLLARARRARVTVVTRLRLDAALYEPAPPRTSAQTGRPRVKGPRLPALAQRLADPLTPWDTLRVPRWYGATARVIEVATGTAVWYKSGVPPVAIRWVLIRDPQGTFAPQALLCTDPDIRAAQIVSWFVLRWQLEVTYHEVRAHLGVETQRQWSDLAILRTTPALLGLFSFVTLLAHDLSSSVPLPVQRAAWYPKTTPTFADALALVRRHLWAHTGFCISPPAPDVQQVPRVLLDRLADLLCYAA
jgi:DDE superfamily endonuclease